MPAPLDLTAEGYAEHVRALARARVKRYRERRNATGNASVAPQGTPGNVTPPHPPPVSPSISKEIEKIKTVLAPFAARGYEHDPDFWAEMAEAYPGARLLVEAYNMASWLKKPLKKNREALCSEGFIINWLKKTQGDAEAKRTTPPQRTGPVDPPIAFQPNPGPDPAPWLTAPLERFSPEEEARMREEHARVPFQERLHRLAAKAAGASNGVHK